MIYTKLKNEDLKRIYYHVRNNTPQVDLSRQLGRTRTNTYYYIGRAFLYWYKAGVIKFRKKSLEPAELGGMDAPLPNREDQ